MKKGGIFFYETIEEYAENNDFEIQEHGRNVIGENIVVLTKDQGYGLAITFVLVALCQYECVYSDIKN